MADRGSPGRIEPFLFDRLTSRGRLVDEVARGRSQTVSSLHLREFVERDLLRLLSTSALEAVIDLDQYPRVARSVINYGLPGVLGDDGTAAGSQSIARKISTAIERFEPRVSRVRVTPVGEGDLYMTFRIEAELWSQPNPQRFSLELDVDVISGIAKAQSRRRQ